MPYIIDDLGLASLILIGLMFGGVVGVITRPTYWCILLNRIRGPKYAVMRLLLPTGDFKIKVVNLTKKSLEIDGQTYILPTEPVAFIREGLAPTFAVQAASTQAGQWQLKELKLEAPLGISRDPELVSNFILKQKQKISASAITNLANRQFIILIIILLLAGLSALFAYLAMDKSSQIATYLSHATIQAATATPK